jgi:hypothetical protein
MERVITADEQMYTGHITNRPRHTQQVDYFVYERQMRGEEMPTGLRRAYEAGPALTARSRA